MLTLSDVSKQLQLALVRCKMTFIDIIFLITVMRKFNKLDLIIFIIFFDYVLVPQFLH